MELNFKVDSSGPVLDGRAYSIMDDAKHAIERDLGELAVHLIQAYLPTQYMYLGMNGGTPEFNPIPANAGTYAAGIHTVRDAPDGILVHDTPVVYGPWIEGVGSQNPIVWPHRRNPPPRRFPGYAAFRKMTQVVNARAESVAERTIQPYIEELNT